MPSRRRILRGGAALGIAVSGQHDTSAGANSHGCREAASHAMDCGDARGHAECESRFAVVDCAVLTEVSAKHVAGDSACHGVVSMFDAHPRLSLRPCRARFSRPS